MICVANSENLLAMTSMGERLKKMREEAGFESASKAAAALGVSASSYRAHENGQNEFSPDMAEKYARKFNTSAAYLLTGENVERPPKPAPYRIVSSFDPDQPENENGDEWDGNGGALVDGLITFNRTISGSSPEFSARPGLGQGQIDDRSARVVSNGIATGHPVVNEWLIPPGYIRNALDAAPSQIIVLPVIGHSMEPVLRSNDRILVDVSQNAWMGDAVYVIDDGDGVLQAKTLKKVTSSHPPAYRIVSEASPDEPPVIRAFDEFRIVGRVVGRFTRM